MTRLFVGQPRLHRVCQKRNLVNLPNIYELLYCALLTLCEVNIKPEVIWKYNFLNDIKLDYCDLQAGHVRVAMWIGSKHSQDSAPELELMHLLLVVSDQL